MFLRNSYAALLSVALAAPLSLAFPQIAHGDSYGMGPGMMSGGMMGGGAMGPGMMGPQEGPAASSSMPVNPDRAQALETYIRSQNLVCLQCHSVSGNGFGPPFALIAATYAGKRGAEEILAEHISQGFGRMPSGLATSAQSARLARMILALPSANGEKRR